MRKISGKSIALWICLAAVIAAAASLALSRCALTVEKYALTTPKLFEHVRIVQLSDLHNSEFGAHNKRLVEKVAAQEPDLILLTGDLLNQTEERTDIAEELIASLTAVAPVYVSYGNHEAGHEARFGTDLRALFSAAGATVLEYGWEDLTVNGQQLRLGGIYGYCMPKRYLVTGECRQKECEFLGAFQDTERCTVLMCHMPVAWQIYGALDGWEIDCVLCGHSHGGQMRLPLVGGLWSPDRGWFPGRESGLYFSQDETKTMALSRGLGSTQKIPRLNNIPEILVLDLLPD